MWDKITDFFVPPAEGAEPPIEDGWAEAGYKQKQFTDAQKEDNYASKKSVYLLINQYAKQYNVNFNLVRAIVQKESSWNAADVTKRQEKPGVAVGYMGLTDDAVNDMISGTCAKRNICKFRTDKYNSDQNIRGGICYYACQYDEFEDVSLALAAYKEGPSYVRNNCKNGINSCKGGKGESAKSYIRKVIDIYQNILTRSEMALKKESQKQIVVIDPGHGGSDPGAVSNDGINEADLNLQIAQKLKELFEEQGYFVKLTRESDKDVSLASRVWIANDLKAQFFISIHMNSANLDINGKYCSAHGTETFYYRDSEEGMRLAELVQYNVVSALETRDRGIKKDTESEQGSLYVLVHNTKMPAVLVEPGFICNEEDIQKLTGSSEQMQLASAISQAVRAYV